jgi:hypothetical protein
MSGIIQPTILGMPFGKSLLDADVSIDKRGIFVGFDSSLHDLTGKLIANNIAPLGIGEFLFNLVTLGLSDHLRFDLKLPLGGVFTTLFGDTGKLPPINPLGNWVGGFTGEIRWLGFTLGQVSGYLFAPGSKNEVDARTFLFYDSTTDFPDPVPPIDPITHEPTDTLKIPISSEDRLHDLETFGGLIATSRSFLPAMLTDPVGLIETMAKPTPGKPQGVFTLPQGGTDQNFIDYIHGVIDTLTQVGDDLGASQERSRVQIYVPAPGTLSLDDLVAKAYISGFVDTELLSVPTGRLHLDATVDGLKIGAELPLAGAQIETTVDFNEDVDLVQAVSDLAHGAGIDLNLPDHHSPITGDIPRIRVTADLNDDRLADVLEHKFGLPVNIIFGAVDADASIQFFSPLFDFDNPNLDPDDPQRNGGVKLDAKLSILNLIDDARFHFQTALFSGGLIPDFTASANFAGHLIIPGFGIPDDQIFQQHLQGLLQKDADGLRLGLSGSLGLLGLVNFDASGTLGITQDGLYGDITLGLDVDKCEHEHPGLCDLANDFFNFDGNFSLQVNTTKEDQTTVDDPPRQIPKGPDGPYLKVHLDGSVAVLPSIKDLHFDLGGTFDAKITGEGATVDATGQLDVDLSALFPVIGPKFSGDVAAHLAVIDGRIGYPPGTDFSSFDQAQLQRIEASMGVPPGDDGKNADGDFNLTLNRWGCMGLEFYNADHKQFEPFTLPGLSGIPLNPLSFDACGEHVYVDNQQTTETNGDFKTHITVRLSEPAERDLRVDYTLASGTADKDTDWRDRGKGFIIIHPGHTTGKIQITIVGDDEFEDDETFFVTLTDAYYVEVDKDNPDGKRLDGLFDPKVVNFPQSSDEDKDRFFGRGKYARA